MNRWREKLNRFMIGRYGIDQLGKFLTGLMMAMFAVNLFLRWRILDMGVFLCLFLCYWRMLSRNVSGRYGENQKYLAYRQSAREAWKRLCFQIEQRRSYHIYRCPGCGQKIRIPRGKGRVSVHCPQCGADFIKRS